MTSVLILIMSVPMELAARHLTDNLAAVHLKMLSAVQMGSIAVLQVKSVTWKQDVVLNKI